MSTTTVRLSPDLRERVAAAAERAGTTAHNFMQQAILEKAEQEEQRHQFSVVADERYARILASGETISWAEMRKLLKTRLEQKMQPSRPRSRRRAR